MAQALNKNDIFYDPVLNAVLQADGVMDSNNNHQFTMLWPSYTALDMHDSVLKRLMAGSYDHWNNVVEYYDSNLCMTIKLDLSSGMTSAVAGVSQSAPPTPPPSLQNWGWTSKDETKKPEPKMPPFQVGSVLFHKDTRTKWLLSDISSSGMSCELRAFDDKTRSMLISDNEFNEFEEIFF